MYREAIPLLPLGPQATDRGSPQASAESARIIEHLKIRMRMDSGKALPEGTRIAQVIYQQFLAQKAGVGGG